MSERDLFIAALQIAPPQERSAWLDRECGGDAALRQRIDVLLQAFDKAGSLLESPVAATGPAIGEPITERPGTVIGPYKLLEQIGEGGMGTVWMAEQSEPIQRRVAVKVVKEGMDSRQVLARFEAERQALALMEHPNIARVLDAGRTPSGRPYFVMELVKGQPITRYCDEKRLGVRERLALFGDVCRAVQHAHQKGIIHRDLKPSNVLVAPYDGKPVVKVIDFGVAKATGQRLTDKTLFTGLGALVGTPEYMSPEQAEINNQDIDTRSDIYALGVLLYELLTGSTPLTRKRLKEAALLEVLRVIREEEPPKPSTRLSESKDSLPSISAQRQTEPAKLTKLVRGELDWIVMKALEKDRNRRYETANGFAMDVQRYLADEPVLACPPSAGYRLRKFARRNKGGLAVAALVLFFLVLLGSGLGWVMRDRSAREAEAARQQGERQAKVAGQVESIFAEVDRLEKEQKWPEALEAARRAAAAVAGGEADPATTERVHQRLRDLEFIDRLERIRIERQTLVEGKFDWAGADRDYARAFRDYGVDIEELPVETSIDRLKTRPALTVALASALDDWALDRRLLSETAIARWQRLVDVARGIDPEPLRDRLRAAWGQPIANVRDDLRRLAESIDVRAQHQATLFILVRTLTVVKLPDSAMRLLRAAQNLHPEDFSLNLLLGHYLNERKDHEGAVRFFTAAVAIRPHSALAHDLLGKALIGQKKLDEAITSCRKAIELDSKYAIAHGTLGYALHEKGLVDEAIAEDRKALELLPKNADAYGSAHTHNNLGMSLAAKGRVDEAIAEYKKAIEIDPKNALAHNNLGNALLDKGRVDEAIAESKKAIELDPTYASPHIGLGNALQDMGREDEAIVEYTKAIGLDPKNAMAHSNLGIALRRKGLVDEGIAEHRKAVEFDPKDAKAHHNLGNALLDKGRVDEAIAEYKKAIELDPKFAFPHIGLGVALATKGLVDESVIKFRKAIELDPNSADAQYNLGIALCQQGKLDEAVAEYRKAVAEYRKAIKLDPKYAEVHCNLGNILYRQKKLDEAVAEYKKAIALNPKSSAAYNGLGNALNGQKNFDAAITAYRKAIDLDPKNGAAHFNLGLTLRGQGKLDEAITEFRKVCELDPKNISAHYNLGHALHAQKKWDEAIAYYKKAIELDPKCAPIHRNLILALQGKGRVDDAIAERKKLIELDPKNAAEHYYLGNDLKAKGDLDGAERAYREAVRLDGNHHGAAIDALAELLLSRGNWKEAIATAREAVKLAPQSDFAWQVLGWAHYRVGEWNASIAALEKSCALQANPKGGNAAPWFFLAMAHWQLGEKDKARELYDRAVQWMDKNQPKNEELRRFRTEAALLLELKEKK
jgi:tetratricopeptide (TPR) repeat protein/serine/threonine protein kinase